MSPSATPQGRWPPFRPGTLYFLGTLLALLAVVQAAVLASAAQRPPAAAVVGRDVVVASGQPTVALPFGEPAVYAHVRADTVSRGRHVTRSPCGAAVLGSPTIAVMDGDVRRVVVLAGPNQLAVPWVRYDVTAQQAVAGGLPGCDRSAARLVEVHVKAVRAGDRMVLTAAGAAKLVAGTRSDHAQAAAARRAKHPWLLVAMAALLAVEGYGAWRLLTLARRRRMEQQAIPVPDGSWR